MIVYHGSNVIVQHPDVIHTHRNLDFGKGFYVTTVKEQAERWAKRKADFEGGIPVLNYYEWNTDLSDIKVQNFDEDLDSWIDFVCNCRDGGEQYMSYDLIIGKVADDKVFRVVDMYHQGIWDKERALKEIRVYPTYDQIAFVTQGALDRHLKFVGGRGGAEMSDEALEKFYQEGLEERLIGNVAKEKRISLEDAMDIYYRSKLAQKIYDGKEGVQYLDYRVLTRLLFDTEPELFQK